MESEHAFDWEGVFPSACVDDMTHIDAGVISPLCDRHHHPRVKAQLHTPPNNGTHRNCRPVLPQLSTEETERHHCSHDPPSPRCCWHMRGTRNSSAWLTFFGYATQTPFPSGTGQPTHTHHLWGAAAHHRLSRVCCPQQRLVGAPPPTGVNERVGIGGMQH